jgi:hypothetical protein
MKQNKKTVQTIQNKVKEAIHNTVSGDQLINIAGGIVWSRSCR